MSQVIEAARRGADIFARAALPLLVGGAAWAVLNVITRGLLIGPALYGLFRIAQRAERGEKPDLTDNLAAFEDISGTLVAGVLFMAPFSLWGVLVNLGRLEEKLMDANPALGAAVLEQSVLGGVPPFLVSLALLVHFGVNVFVFSYLSERRGTLRDAFGAALELADRRGASMQRISHLGRQIAFTSLVLGVFLLLWGLQRGAGWLLAFLAFAMAPAVTCALVAWQRLAEQERARAGIVVPAEMEDTPSGGPA